MPVMEADDFDGDGQEELFCSLYIGSGTGVAVEELHVIEYTENSIKDYILNPDLYADAIEKAVTCTFDKSSKEVVFNADNVTLRYAVPDIDEWADINDFNGLAGYTEMVHFECNANTIKTKFGLGFRFDFAAAQFTDFTIKADIVYSQNGFSIKNVGIQ